MKLSAIWYVECQNEPSRAFFLELPGVDLDAEITAHFTDEIREQYSQCLEEGEELPTITFEKNNHYGEFALSAEGTWLFASTEGWEPPV